MLFPSKMRAVLLSIALIATFVAVFMAQYSGTDASVVLPTTYKPSPRKDAPAKVLRIPEIIVIRSSDGSHENPFFKPVAAPVIPTESMLEASAPVSAASPIIAPPPLPYVYQGKMEDNGQTIIFLGRGDDSLSVRIGEILDKTYLVQEMNDKSITLVYLPMDVKQILMIGEL